MIFLNRPPVYKSLNLKKNYTINQVDQKNTLGNVLKLQAVRKLKVQT